MKSSFALPCCSWRDENNKTDINGLYLINPSSELKDRIHEIFPTAQPKTKKETVNILNDIFKKLLASNKYADKQNLLKLLKTNLLNYVKDVNQDKLIGYSVISTVEKSSKKTHLKKTNLKKDSSENDSSENDSSEIYISDKDSCTVM